MKKKYKIATLILSCLVSVVGSIFIILRSDIPVLDPKGWIAQQEKDLLITTSLLLLIVIIPVFVFTLGFAYHYRENNPDARHEPNWEHNSIAECLWWGVPVFIILILSILTWKTTHQLDPFRPLDSTKEPVEVQVVALQWKWLFIYPKEGIATVNFLQFPENTPVNFTLTGDAPMNSFWIPRLGGQIYAMSGMRSKLHLIANEIGDFRGRAAHINGKGVAGMVFTARASSEEDFYSWGESVRNEGSLLDFASYQELAKPSQYVPVQYYTVNEDLFEKIIDQYKTPKLK